MYKSSQESQTYITVQVIMDACNNKMMVNNDRDKLENYMRKLESSKTSPVITAEEYNEIVAHLKAPNDKVYPHFKAWVKN